FWGAFDLAVTRFSGRTAPRHPGGFPNVGDFVMHEAYSHELSSAGFWPGTGLGEAAFYAYAYPAPDGFSTAPVAPAAAYFHEGLGEFLLPYESVRTAADPDEALLAFLQSTYEAAGDRAGRYRPALERARSNRPIGPTSTLTRWPYGGAPARSAAARTSAGRTGGGSVRGAFRIVW